MANLSSDAQILERLRQALLRLDESDMQLIADSKVFQMSALKQITEYFEYVVSLNAELRRARTNKCDPFERGLDEAPYLWTSRANAAIAQSRLNALKYQTTIVRVNGGGWGGWGLEDRHNPSRMVSTEGAKRLQVAF